MVCLDFRRVAPVTVISGPSPPSFPVHRTKAALGGLPSHIPAHRGEGQDPSLSSPPEYEYLNIGLLCLYAEPGFIGDRRKPTHRPHLASMPACTRLHIDQGNRIRWSSGT